MTGKPRADTARTVSMHIRLTAEEAAELEKLAKKLNTTKTAAIMQGLELLKKKQ